jgi:Cu+-exporting ATPase
MGAKKDITLNVEGMTCSNCAMGISRYLEKKGLEEVSVNFSTQEASFRLDDQHELSTIIKGIESIGYRVLSDDQAKQTGYSAIEKKFIASLFFTVPLFLHMFFPKDSFLNNGWVQLGICIPVFLIGTWHFGKSAWNSLKTGVPNMDVLIFIGISSAFGYSLAGLFLKLGYDYLFFETAATITTLVLLGNVIEHRSVKQTTTAIQELSKLQPQRAIRVISNLLSSSGESTEEIDYKEIRQGDVLLVNAGSAIPTDGRIEWGEAVIDESMISGESIPVDKQVGNQVIGGTILKEGPIRIKASAVGEETVLSKIIELVKKAQTEKPDIQRLADKISQYFVPIVLVIAIGTFFISHFVLDVVMRQALLNSVAILVIACPCAMGLATPTAVMVGIGRAARNGILIKGGATLEVFARVQQVIFDKTGTLTTGEFEIREIGVESGTEEEVKKVLATLEQHSAHPIAKSIVRSLKGMPTMTFREISEEKGLGVKGVTDNGDTYQAGSHRLLQGQEAGSHHVYVLKNEKLIGWVDLVDEVKEDAASLVAYLKSMNIEPIMLSGDSEARCKEVADQLGIDQVYSDRSPEEKLEMVESLSANKQTAMVGDGINDAPALAKADIGVSLSSGTQVAIHAASIILLQGKLEYLEMALKVSRHTLKTIKQNLFWAFFYNVIAIPIAAIGLLNPMVAALSMAFSDVFVIGNSIRLRTKKLY